MAGITDKWVRHLRTRDRQDKAELDSFTCNICGEGINTLEAWLEHAKSDQKHQEGWPTLESAQLSYVNKGSNRPNCQNSNSRKRRADTTDGTVVDQDPDADGHQAKRRLPEPSAPGRSPTRNARRNDRGGRPYQNTSGRQLWTSDGGVQQKSQGQRRASGDSPPRQGPTKANRPT